VITGNGKAFSAGGDFTYLEELRGDPDLRARTIAHGRDLVLGMARCRVPVVAAVNGPAVGLGCSLVALSDIVYFAETAYLADPHVQVGLVAADGDKAATDNAAKVPPSWWHSTSYRTGSSDRPAREENMHGFDGLVGAAERGRLDELGEELPAEQPVVGQLLVTAFETGDGPVGR
jgi:hypothetical protein